MVNNAPSARSRLRVLRIGHRVQRDMRVTTHVCLTARALGAGGVYVSDVKDRRLVDTINRVTEEFGGEFRVEMGRPWRQTVIEWKKSGGRVVHLTAYGIPLPQIVDRIKSSREDLLIVIGAEKVPRELFRLADWNVAITSQPISEVSALGIFLDWLSDHSKLEEQFKDAKIRILPSEHGKRVVNR